MLRKEQFISTKTTMLNRGKNKVYSFLYRQNILKDLNYTDEVLVTMLNQV